MTLYTKRGTRYVPTTLSDWFFTLITWAGERRRRAAELMRAGPQQKELFE